MGAFFRVRRVAIVAISLILLGFSGVFVVPSSTADAKTFPCRSGRATYIAVRNDSWSRIADKVGVPVKSLLRANKATTRTWLLIGDVVCLPKSVPAKDSSQTRAQELRLDAPATVYSVRQSRKVIREVFPRHLRKKAMAIARRESRLNAAAYSWCCAGLFQLNWWSHRKWLSDMGITSPQQLLDARVNADAALALYRRSGSWAPWE